MRLERFTDKAQEAFQEAQEIMHEQHHTQLDVEHIFLAMLRQKDGFRFCTAPAQFASRNYAVERRHADIQDCYIRVVRFR